MTSFYLLLSVVPLYATTAGAGKTVADARDRGRRARDARFIASALWNLAYDAGTGLGAAGFGVVAVQAGCPGAFAIVGSLMLMGLVPVSRDRGWLGAGN
jgi:predicted MFS family arabinose efflux permease